MRNNFLLYFGGLQTTLEHVKYVNNLAEMIKNPLQWGVILHENGYRPQLEVMSHVILLGFSLGVAQTLNCIRNQWSDVAFAFAWGGVSFVITFHRNGCIYNSPCALIYT